MDILYGTDGNPLAMTGKKIIAVTTNVGKKTLENTSDKFVYNDREYVMWGAANRQPEDDEQLIGKTTVLRTVLNFKCRVAHGQGCIPVTIEGYDEICNEIYKPVQNKELINYLNSYGFEYFLTTTFQNLFKFGNAFPVFTFNHNATKIVRTTAFSARHCRISKQYYYEAATLVDNNTANKYDLCVRSVSFYKNLHPFSNSFELIRNRIFNIKFYQPTGLIFFKFCR